MPFISLISMKHAAKLIVAGAGSKMISTQATECIWIVNHFFDPELSTFWVDGLCCAVAFK